MMKNIAMLYISINFYQPIYHLPKNQLTYELIILLIELI